jgi:hypothetical protein
MEIVLKLFFGAWVILGILGTLMMCAFKKPEVSILSILFGGGFLFLDPTTYFEVNRIPQIMWVMRLSFILFFIWLILEVGNVMSGLH